MLLSAVCNGKVPCVLCDRMLTFLRLYSICGNLRGSVTHWYSTALQFQQMIYFIRLFRHPFRRKATMASFCCQPIPRSYDPHQEQWVTGICGCFFSLLFIKSPTPPAEPDWPISCSYQMRECRYPAWWMAGCGPAGPLRWLRQRRQRSAGWRWCAAGSGRSRR